MVFADYVLLDERHSYVTLATNDEYAVGALVLGHSLRRAGISKEITVLVTEGVFRGFRWTDFFLITCFSLFSVFLLPDLYAIYSMHHGV